MELVLLCRRHASAFAAPSPLSRQAPGPPRGQAPSTAPRPPRGRAAAGLPCAADGDSRAVEPPPATTGSVAAVEPRLRRTDVVRRGSLRPASRARTAPGGQQSSRWLLRRGVLAGARPAALEPWSASFARGRQGSGSPVATRGRVPPPKPESGLACGQARPCWGQTAPAPGRTAAGVGPRLRPLAGGSRRSSVRALGPPVRARVGAGPCLRR